MVLTHFFNTLGYNIDPYVIDQPCLTNLFMRGKVMGSFYKIVPLHNPPKLLTGNLFLRSAALQEGHCQQPAASRLATDVLHACAPFAQTTGQARATSQGSEKPDTIPQDSRAHPLSDHQKGERSARGLPEQRALGEIKQACVPSCNLVRMPGLT